MPKKCFNLLFFQSVPIIRSVRRNFTLSMKSSYYLDLLRGRSQELPDVRSKVVRVFVSSTFTG